MSDLLTPDEIDALLEGISTGVVDTHGLNFAPEGVEDYDLTAHERIIQDGSPALGLINQLFGRYLQKALRRLLHDEIEITVESTRVTKYGDYLATLEFPTNLNLVDLANLNGQSLFVLSSELIQNYVDYYFGGGDRGPAGEVKRDFTATEIGVASRVLTAIFRDYTKAWEAVASMELSIVQQESNPLFGAFFGPGESMVVSNFVVNFDAETTGWLDVVIPSALLDPMRELLEAADRGNQAHQRRAWTTALKQALQEANLEVSTNLAYAQVSLGELVRLKPGDVIPVELPNIIELCANAMPVYSGSYGLSGGHHAFQVTSPISIPNSSQA